VGSGVRDVFFSACVDADGPLPGPSSIKSLAIVFAGSFDGHVFLGPCEDVSLYREMDSLRNEDVDAASPVTAIVDMKSWVLEVADGGRPVFVAYSKNSDWMWVYWYSIRFLGECPFERVFDLDTACLIKGLPGTLSGLRATAYSHPYGPMVEAVARSRVFAALF
jgi:hypothetical protein